MRVTPLAEDKAEAETSHPRREYLLTLLAEASGPSYDELCRAVIGRFGTAGANPWWAKARNIRAVRKLLFDELAVTESDESMWLTPAGWALVKALGLEPARRAS